MSKPYVISFANQKGGVGKTTSCINIASCAASLGYKVLIIDSDPQGNSTSGVGIEKKKISKTVYDVLLDNANPDEVIAKTEFENLWVVPSTINLAGAEFELIDVDHRELQMKKFIEKCDAYDLIVIDCPPSLSMLTVNALTASDGVIIPMQCEYYALEGLTQLMITIKKVKEFYNPTLSVLGILITVLLCIPINIIVHALTNIPGLSAFLPWYGYLLILVSMALTMIAGLLPSMLAARKDPVIALRSE